MKRFNRGRSEKKVMYCIKCGSALENHARFCTNCGAQIINDYPKKKNRTSKKQIVVLITAIFLAVCFFATYFYVKNIENHNKMSADNFYTYFMAGGSVEGFYDQEGNVYPADYQIQNISQKDYSGTRQSACYVLDNELFFLKNGKVINVENELGWRSGRYNGVSSAKISYNGETIAFVNKSLYVYYEGIQSQNAYIDEGKNYVLSPNGKYIFYVKESDSSLCCAMIGYGQQISRISKQTGIPLAVSDSGKDFFYLGKDLKLYYSNGQEEKCLSDYPLLEKEYDTEYDQVYGRYGDCYFNVSCDEVLYSDNPSGDSQKLYYYKAGNMNRKELGDRSMPLAWIKVKVMEAAIPDDLGDYESLPVVIMGTDSFNGGYFYNHTENALYNWDKNLDQMSKIEEELIANQIYTSEESSRVLYLKDQRIYRFDKESREKECVYDDVLTFSSSKDLNELYIHTVDGKLKYVNFQEYHDTELVQLPNLVYGSYSEQQQAYIALTEKGELYKIAPNTYQLLASKVSTASIDVNGAVIYTIYDNNQNACVYMLMKDDSSKRLYYY